MRGGHSIGLVRLVRLVRVGGSCILAKNTVCIYSIIHWRAKYTSDFIFYRKFNQFSGVDGGATAVAVGKRPSVVEALSTIEREVAIAFGLTRNELQTVYSADENERRGFWRFFKSDPHAHKVVSRVLSEW